MESLKLFLRQNADNFNALDNVSDYFGNAELNEDGDTFEGSIGVKMGVRLCYMPPKDFNLSIAPTPEREQSSIKHRSYLLEPASFSVDGEYESTLESSRYSFPICSYEQDISDVKMLELLDSNSNLDQELKCYIDKLVKTDNYKHLMNNVLQIKKIPSIYMIYSYVNLIPSLGTGEERSSDSDDEDIRSDDIGKIFNNSKAEARKLYVSYYRNNDRDPPDEEQNGEDIVALLQRKLLELLSPIDLGEFSWDIRRRNN